MGTENIMDAQESIKNTYHLTVGEMPPAAEYSAIKLYFVEFAPRQVQKSVQQTARAMVLLQTNGTMSVHWERSSSDPDITNEEFNLAAIIAVDVWREENVQTPL